jgi:hypothetical protein
MIVWYSSSGGGGGGSSSRRVRPACIGILPSLNFQLLFKKAMTSFHYANYVILYQQSLNTLTLPIHFKS